MEISNYLFYGLCEYNNTITDADDFKLGDVVINDQNEIGVIIQVHSDCEFRTDMFGNTSSDEIRLATSQEVETFRPNVINEGTFIHKK